MTHDQTREAKLAPYAASRIRGLVGPAVQVGLVVALAHRERRLAVPLRRLGRA